MTQGEADGITASITAYQTTIQSALTNKAAQYSAQHIYPPSGDDRRAFDTAITAINAIVNAAVDE